MKQRWESAKKDAEYFHKAGNMEAAERQKCETALDLANAELKEYRKRYDELSAGYLTLHNQHQETLKDVDQLHQTIHDKDLEIITLKARLFDLLYKEVI